MFAGLAAHAILDLRAPLTASFGLTFAATAHTVGWPMAVGGSQRIADGLVSYLPSLGGDVVLRPPRGSLGELPPAPGLPFGPPARHVLDLSVGPAHGSGPRRL